MNKQNIVITTWLRAPILPGSIAIPSQLSKEDAALFRQPTIEGFRLSYVDFSAFKTIDKEYLMHTNLDTLVLEVCPRRS